MRQPDLNAGGTLEDSERTFAAYDSRWRIVATFADQAAAPAEAFVHHGAGFGAGGGSSYIDSVILRDRDADTPTDESHTPEERRCFCQNWRADVIAGGVAPR